MVCQHHYRIYANSERTLDACRGGGGGGGGYAAGGGGAGGVLYGQITASHDETARTVTIGDGGTGGLVGIIMVLMVEIVVLF